ncbi:MAG: 4-(cytidine 5'-diphospho)-2-C-methyl-D-erythritol kinase, partial [Senegalia sp. (in: firmicutes)]
MKIELDAFAKINLSLDVLRKREDGYHELEMIMQQISL